MSMTRRGFTAAAGLGLAGTMLPRAAAAAKPPFAANWDSLTAGYRAPEWFRDAKFGIWAHWSAQCVPEFGDWYARKMYIQGNPFYEHHCKTYGHPSRFGFMQFDHMWKAEHWDPEALIKRYVAAGAKYFVALACHHDNLDTYDSRYHAWNTLRIGPQRDIVGTWAKIARAHGLKFGVSNHASRVWHWFQTAYGYDAEGPMAGVRYDAYTLTKADGAGQWWQGLDPQELYGGRSMVIPDGITSIKEMTEWHRTHDRVWEQDPPPGHEAFIASWQRRCLDLLDSYRPDLIYFDDYGLPLGQAGLDVTAHYYNAGLAWHDGRQEVVVNAKMLPPEHRSGVVEDVERGLRADISPLPWQTDTCIGEWHYSRPLYERHGYKSVAWVVQALCDIVSKNGNLLLSVPLRGDGSIDADEDRFLAGMAAWMRINGEAIYATRPWRIFGEGKAVIAGGMFGEKKNSFSAADVRFTCKNGALYALILGWPDGGRVEIKALGGNARHAKQAAIERVELLGAGALDFTRTADALSLTLPESQVGNPAYALKIIGRGLA